ncbi:hypothetical protein TKK_0016583 [Trichogramma kaykai]
MRSFISRKNRRDLNPDYLKRLNSGLLAARKKELISRQLEIQNLNVVNTPDLPQQNSNDFYVRNENDFCDHNDERYNPYYVDEINVSNQCSGSSDDDSEYSEYSDSSDDETDTLIDFEKRLGDAFLSTNMTHVQMKKILDVLHTHPCFSNLPKDPRTILKTPRDSAPIQLIAGGEYLHLGFEVAVELILNSTPSNFIPPTLLIDFFTDEACLDKRSNIRIWPIEIRIPNISHCEPEIVGVWKGDKKPTSAVELMKPFVDDVLVVLEAGGTVLYNNIKIPFQIRCFIADSPARAFIINHMGHNSRFPCCKCWIEGDYLHNSRVMVFPGIDHPLRSSESYKNKVDGEHHKEGEGSLDKLPIDLVSQTVFEYMHLCCLGVMEKILAGLVNGKYAESVKLSKINKLILDARLSEITKFCPRDFARKPTKIDKHSNFKATEFRQILLYSGAAIFSGIVREDVLVHYFLFQSAMRIYLSTDPSQELLNSAEFFIKLFIQSSEKVYGLEFLTYVTHGLLHLIEDIRNFGPLGSYSAFPYENHMMYFRKICRKPNHHLQQIWNRRCEARNKSVNNNHFQNNIIQLKGKHNRRLSPQLFSNQNYRQFSSVQYKTLFLNLQNNNNTVLSRDGRVGIVKSIIELDNHSCFLVVRLFDNVHDLFNLGEFRSSSIGMFRVSSLSKILTKIPLESVAAKCFRMPFWNRDNSTLLPEIGEETMPPKRPAGTGASNLFGNIMFMENAMHEHAKKRKTVNLTKSSNVSTKSSSSALSKSLSVSSKPSSISSKPSSASSKPSSGVSKSSSILSKLPSKGVLPSKKNLSHALINGQVPSEDSTVPGQPSYGYDSHTTSSLNHSLPPSSTLQPLNQNLSFSNRFDLLAQSPSSLGNKDVQSTNNLSVLPSASGQVMNKVIPSSRIVNPPKTNMLNLNKLSEKVDEIYERQDILLKAIMDIREGQRKEMEILEKIAKKKRGKVGEMPTFLPFESVASLMEFDTVASETDYDALVGYFEYISGVNIHDHCTRMISDGLALSETLLKSITWKGATKKYKLETSRFAEACKDAATRNDNFKDPTDLEFGEAMKACLKNYKEKLRRHLQDEESASIRKIRPREAIPREHQEDRVDPDDDQVLGQASEEEIDEESEQSYPEIPEDVFTRYEEQEDDEEDTEEI